MLNPAWRERVAEFNGAERIRYSFAAAVSVWPLVAVALGAFLFGYAVGGC